MTAAKIVWMLLQDYQVVMDKQLMQYLHTPKKNWRMLQNCSKFRNQNGPDVWGRLPRHKWPKSWERKIEDLVVPLERNLYGHPLAGLLWERQFEQALSELGWGEKFRTGNVCSFTVNKEG